MIYTQKDGRKLAKIALGGADFGTNVSKQDSFALMDLYFENGGNILDTARVYCTWLENGANVSESTIGEWVKSRGVREQIWISTKGGHPPIIDHHISRIQKKELRKDIEESLRYLQTDYIDMYFLHRDDESKPVEEIMPILHEFVKEGKARYIGAGNWTAERIAKANAFARENGLTPFSFSQIMWSYAKVNKEGEPDDTLVIMDEKEYAGCVENKDVILMPYSSQAQGFYTLAAERGVETLSDRHKAKYVNETNLARLQTAKRISQECGLSPTAVGLNHLLRNTEIDTHPLIGGFNKELLLDSLQALDLPEKYFEEITEKP
ncbi:MAG: aldo/keto reductase [Clostridia bacterium]|nr:aldo/keto reductase [Clostridia bacterium]